MNKFSTYLSLILASFCIPPSVTQAMARLDNNGNYGLPNGWFINLEGGAAWPYMPNFLKVPNGAPIITGFGLDDLTTNSPTNGILQVTGGYKFLHDSWWFPGVAVGVRYQHFFSDNVNGQISQYSLPQFTNYLYSFNISADVVSVNAKIDLFNVDRFFPYFDVGIGAAFNNANNYNETPLFGVIPRISPAFVNNSQTNFAWNIGGGLDFLITPRLTISLGYDYQFLGAMQTGSGVGSWAGTNLNLGNYGANVITAGFTYFTDSVVYAEK